MNKKIKLFTFLLVVSMLAFTSCKKDNDNLPTAGGTGVPGDSDGTINGHEYVDFELPSGTLWATCNVGANSPEDYGNYFAWGETEAKSTYNWSTYKWCNGSENTLEKYNTNSNCGIVDNITVLELANDVAHKSWGGSWCMPTKAEIQELKDNCTWTWATLGGKNGYLVTGSNGKSIFLPAAGSYYNGRLYVADSYGYYWSSSLDADRPNYACDLYFDSSMVKVSHSLGRYYGSSVRPVCNLQNK